jgi:hypothetical protein
MREVSVRWRDVVGCAVMLSIVGTADARSAAPVRTADAEARPRVAAAERETRERPLPRILRRIIKSLSDGLTGPRP